MKRRDPRNPTEYQIQTAVADYLRANAAPGVLWLHVPNQQASGPRRGAYLKRMGVYPGAADLVLFCGPEHPTRTHTLWLELKARGGRPTAAQFDFAKAARAIGHDWTWASSVDGAIDYLKRAGWCR